jgi:signal transduction histidine kinase
MPLFPEVSTPSGVAERWKMVRTTVQNIRVRPESAPPPGLRVKEQPSNEKLERDESYEGVAEVDRLRTASLLAAGLAHEVANPLLSVLSSIAEVEHIVPRLRTAAGSTNPERWEMLHDCVDQAHRSAEAIAEVVRDFQVFLRPAASRVERLVEAGPLVERAIRMARPQIKMVANLNACIESTPSIKVPPSFVTQIALNLVMNATEALAGLDSRRNVIDVKVARAGEHVVIEVSDNGPGLSEADATRVFEPHVTTKSSGSSLGLGLSICRALAEKVGGSISVKSVPNERTTFRVVLPVAPQTPGVSE